MRAAHFLPQPPQLLGSVAVLTQAEPQRVREAAIGGKVWRGQGQGNVILRTLKHDKPGITWDAADLEQQAYRSPFQLA